MCFSCLKQVAYRQILKMTVLLQMVDKKMYGGLQRHCKECRSVFNMKCHCIPQLQVVKHLLRFAMYVPSLGLFTKKSIKS